MSVYALAARPFAISTWLAAGVWPRLAPPVRSATYDVRELEGHDLLYLCLHGLPGQPYWYGGDWSTALSATQILTADLSGTIVYAAGCFGLGPVAAALIGANARAVVGDRDTTFSGYIAPVGSNGLGRLFVRALHKGATAGAAIEWAKWEYLKRHDSPRDYAMCASVTVVGDRTARLTGGGQ